MFFHKKNNNELYNILLTLSRNKFFYEKIHLSDSFETRVYLMFIHFSIILKIFKRKKIKFEQSQYDFLFHSIENNLRELGFGDISVNKKMKDLNKIFYDILLKFEKKTSHSIFKIDETFLKRYFFELKNIDIKEFNDFRQYFLDFYNYCFEISLENMLKELKNFKF
tara:strand:- start:82 stop:579 length:498 start_codon:yes stop_codon:yes gene_type:complete